MDANIGGVDPLKSWLDMALALDGARLQHKKEMTPQPLWGFRGSDKIIIIFCSCPPLHTPYICTASCYCCTSVSYYLGKFKDNDKIE